MDHNYYDDGSGMSRQEMCGDDKGTEPGRSMLSHVISLLQALVGILDIISDSFSRYR